MSAVSVNVTLSKEQLAVINREVEAGHYMSPSEVVREAVRLWLERRIAADLMELERAHVGAWERDTTPEEEAAILRIQKSARAKFLARRKAKGSALRKARRT